MLFTALVHVGIFVVITVALLIFSAVIDFIDDEDD